MLTKTDSIRDQVLEANKTSHDRESVVYERAHPEIFSVREQKRIDHLISRVVEQLPDRCRRALDLGCGTGNITVKLLKNGFKVDAVDISQGMLDVLKKRVAGEDEKLSLVNDDLDHFLSAGNTLYDCIAVSSVLHHLPDYVSVLRKMVTRLAPGGILLIAHEVIGTEGRRWIKYVVWFDAVLFNVLFLRRAEQKVIFGIDYGLVDYQVSRGFSIQKVRETCDQANLALLHEEQYTSLKFGLTSWIMERLLHVQLHFAYIFKKM